MSSKSHLSNEARKILSDFFKYRQGTQSAWWYGIKFDETEDSSLAYLFGLTREKVETLLQVAGFGSYTRNGLNIKRNSIDEWAIAEQIPNFEMDKSDIEILSLRDQHLVRLGAYKNNDVVTAKDQFKEDTRPPSVLRSTAMSKLRERLRMLMDKIEAQASPEQEVTLVPTPSSNLLNQSNSTNTLYSYSTGTDDTEKRQKHCLSWRISLQRRTWKR